MVRGVARTAAALAVAAALVAGGCGDSPPDHVAGLACVPRGPDVPWFRDATRESGVDFEFVAVDFRGGPIAVADTDGEGRLDIMAGSRGGGLGHFRNMGGWSFIDDTAAAGLEVAGPVHFIAPVDLDNDGDRDLVVASDRLLLFENRGGGRFGAPVDLGDGSRTEHVLPVDLDADGLVELYVSNRDRDAREPSRNRLLHNRGGLVLDDLPGAGGGDSDGLTWTTSAIDFDGDGDLDLHVANDTLVADYGQPRADDVDLPPDAFYRNDSAGGEIRLTDIAAELGLDGPRSSMDGLVADVDGDRRLDLYVTDYGRKKLFLGTDTGFEERGEELGLAGTTRSDGICALTINQERRSCLLLSWAAQLADFDGDGNDDMIVVNGVSVVDGQPAPALVLRGPPPFEEVDAGLDCFEGHGAIAADLDDDGDSDLVASTREGPLRLFENVAPAPATRTTLHLSLQGRSSNRDGLGAVVEVSTARGRRLVRAVGAGGVAQSAPPPVLDISLGDDAVEAIEVRWPSGARQQLPAPDQTRVIVVESSTDRRSGSAMPTPERWVAPRSGILAR